MEEQLITQGSSVDDLEDVADPWCLGESPKVIKFQDIKDAAERIKGGVYYSPCDKSRMSEIANMEIYCKKEFMQFTGNFKERGARNAIMLMDESARKNGIVAASAGNHAQAVSYHGLLLNAPATVVMPEMAPIMKITKCRDLKATVVVRGRDMVEAKKIALNIGKANGLTYINGYDHPHVLAGAGTIGLEIMEQVPDVDAVVVPAGGGGLLAGISLAVKSIRPETTVIAVEAIKCPGFSTSLKSGKPTLVTCEASLADGLAVPLVGFNSFATAQPHVDKMVTVKESNLALAILRLVEIEKAVVEGAGAAPLAAVLEGHLNEFIGKKVVLVISGGNIDTTILGRVLERGLAADGRLMKVAVTISDRPGGMSELAKLMASVGVSIKDVYSERAWVENDVFSVEITMSLETRDAEHSRQVAELLRKNYKKVVV